MTLADDMQREGRYAQQHQQQQQGVEKRATQTQQQQATMQQKPRMLVQGHMQQQQQQQQQHFETDTQTLAQEQRQQHQQEEQQQQRRPIPLDTLTGGNSNVHTSSFTLSPSSSLGSCGACSTGSSAASGASLYSCTAFGHAQPPPAPQDFLPHKIHSVNRASMNGVSVDVNKTVLMCVDGQSTEVHPAHSFGNGQGSSSDEELQDTNDNECRLSLTDAQQLIAELRCLSPSLSHSVPWGDLLDDDDEEEEEEEEEGEDKSEDDLYDDLTQRMFSIESLTHNYNNNNNENEANATTSLQDSNSINNNNQEQGHNKVNVECTMSKISLDGSKCWSSDLLEMTDTVRVRHVNVQPRDDFPLSPTAVVSTLSPQVKAWMPIHMRETPIPDEYNHMVETPIASHQEMQSVQHTSSHKSSLNSPGDDASAVTSCVSQSPNPQQRFVCFTDRNVSWSIKDALNTGSLFSETSTIEENGCCLGNDDEVNENKASGNKASENKASGNESILMKAVERGLCAGFRPCVVDSLCSGGVYIAKDQRGRLTGVIKPGDEEAYALNNPRGFGLRNNSDSTTASVAEADLCADDVNGAAGDNADAGAADSFFGGVANYTDSNGMCITVDIDEADLCEGVTGAAGGNAAGGAVDTRTRTVVDKGQDAVDSGKIVGVVVGRGGIVACDDYATGATDTRSRAVVDAGCEGVDDTHADAEMRADVNMCEDVNDAGGGGRGDGANVYGTGVVASVDCDVYDDDFGAADDEHDIIAVGCCEYDIHERCHIDPDTHDVVNIGTQAVADTGIQAVVDADTHADVDASTHADVDASTRAVVDDDIQADANVDTHNVVYAGAKVETNNNTNANADLKDAEANYVTSQTTTQDKQSWGLKTGVLAGEAMYREAAVYLLDHDHFAGVPHTTIIHATPSSSSPVPGRCSCNQLSSGGHMPCIACGWESEGALLAPRVASLQAYVKHECSADDVGPLLLPVDQLRRISILDIRTFNSDRHAGNILLRTQMVGGDDEDEDENDCEQHDRNGSDDVARNGYMCDDDDDDDDDVIRSWEWKGNFRNHNQNDNNNNNNNSQSCESTTSPSDINYLSSLREDEESGSDNNNNNSSNDDDDEDTVRATGGNRARGVQDSGNGARASGNGASEYGASTFFGVGTAMTRVQLGRRAHSCGCSTGFETLTTYTEHVVPFPPENTVKPEVIGMPQCLENSDETDATAFESLADIYSERMEEPTSNGSLGNDQLWHTPTTTPPRTPPSFRLKSKSFCATDLSSVAARVILTPIDHGYCLPSIFHLDDPEFAWMQWSKQSQTPLSAREKAYVLNLDPFQEAQMLRSMFNARIKEDALLTLVVCTIFLQICIRYGLSPYQVGSMMSTSYSTKQIEIAANLVGLNCDTSVSILQRLIDASQLPKPRLVKVPRSAGKTKLELELYLSELKKASEKKSQPMVKVEMNLEGQVHIVEGHENLEGGWKSDVNRARKKSQHWEGGDLVTESELECETRAFLSRFEGLLLKLLEYREDLPLNSCVCEVQMSA